MSMAVVYSQDYASLTNEDRTDIRRALRSIGGDLTVVFVASQAQESTFVVVINESVEQSLTEHLDRRAQRYANAVAEGLGGKKVFAYRVEVLVNRTHQGSSAAVIKARQP